MDIRNVFSHAVGVRALSGNDVVFGKGLLSLIRALASLRFRLAGQGGLFLETTWFSEKVCFR